jgi:hypothetical protein
MDLFFLVEVKVEISSSFLVLIERNSFYCI